MDKSTCTCILIIHTCKIIVVCAFMHDCMYVCMLTTRELPTQTHTTHPCNSLILSTGPSHIHMYILTFYSPNHVKQQALCGPPHRPLELRVYVGGSAGTLSPPLPSCPNYVVQGEEWLKAEPFYPAQEGVHLCASGPPTPPA